MLQCSLMSMGTPFVFHMMNIQWTRFERKSIVTLFQRNHFKSLRNEHFIENVWEIN